MRLRGVIVVLWRAGVRTSEALAVNETDLDPDRGSLLIRHGKGDKRREVGMDPWAWTQLEPWLKLRSELPVGRLFCITRGPTRGRPCASVGIWLVRCKRVEAADCRNAACLCGLGGTWGGDCICGRPGPRGAVRAEGSSSGVQGHWGESDGTRAPTV